jgi:hypothetical protein
MDNYPEHLSTSAEAIPTSSPRIKHHEPSDVDTLDMVTNSPILQDAEVFNTYGEGLTNGQLVARYGFAVDGNENECLTWDVDELEAFAMDQKRQTSYVDGLIRVWKEIVGIWPNEPVWEYSELVYNARDAVLKLNGDARITHQLWIFCALASLVEQPTAGGTIKLELREMADLQVAVENRTRSEDRVPARSALTQTIRTLLCLVAFRRGQIGKEGASILDLGEIADVSG